MHTISMGCLMLGAMLAGGGAMAQGRVAEQHAQAGRMTAAVAREALPLTATVPHTASAGTFNEPFGMTLDAAGNLYVANIYGGIGIYNTSHKLTATITAGVSNPSAVAVSFDGTIFVANDGASTITIYNTSYTQVGTITDATLMHPLSMFIDADDSLWVLDSSGLLHLYSHTGAPLSTYASGGSAIGPWGPNVAAWGVLNSTGGYDENFENRGQAMHDGVNLFNGYVNGSPRVGAMVEDRLGQEYVTDIVNNQVQIWSANGAYKVGTIAVPALTYGLAVDSVRGLLYASVTGKNAVLVYSTKAPYRLIGTMH